MCRNIKMLFNFDPPVTPEEIRAASLQYVRKISGFNKPSKANEAAFLAAIDEVADGLHPSAPFARNQCAAKEPRRRSGQGERPEARRDSASSSLRRQRKPLFDFSSQRRRLWIGDAVHRHIGLLAMHHQDQVVEIRITRVSLIQVLGIADIDRIRLRSAAATDDIADPGMFKPLVIVHMP